MKTLNIILILFILTTQVLAYNFSPKTLSIGDGEVANINDANAIFINPAGIANSESDQFSLSIIKPFKFYSFSYLSRLGLGVSLIQIEDFYSYEIASGIKLWKWNFINIGINLAVNREITTTKKEYLGFSFSPGLQFNIKNFSSDSPFEIKVGTYLKNLLTIKKIEKFMDFDIKWGCNFKVFFEPVSFYFGGNKKPDLSIGADFKIFNFLSIQIGYKEQNNILSGISTEFLQTFSSLGMVYNIKNKEYNYIISFIKLFESAKKKSKSVKEDQTKEISAVILEKQKLLLEEGLNYYKEQDYINAKKKWQQCYNLAPNSSYGKESLEYIKKVNKILEKMRE